MRLQEPLSDYLVNNGPRRARDFTHEDANGWPEIPLQHNIFFWICFFLTFPSVFAFFLEWCVLRSFHFAQFLLSLFNHTGLAYLAKFHTLNDTQLLWSLGIPIFSGLLVAIYDKIITHGFTQAQMRPGVGVHGVINNNPLWPWNFVVSVLVAIVTHTGYVLLVH